jgi:hypothetical protein
MRKLNLEKARLFFYLPRELIGSDESSLSMIDGGDLGTDFAGPWRPLRGRWFGGSFYFAHIFL